MAEDALQNDLPFEEIGVDLVVNQDADFVSAMSKAGHQFTTFSTQSTRLAGALPALNQALEGISTALFNINNRVGSTAKVAEALKNLSKLPEDMTRIRTNTDEAGKSVERLLGSLAKAQTAYRENLKLKRQLEGPEGAKAAKQRFQAEEGVSQKDRPRTQGGRAGSVLRYRESDLVRAQAQLEKHLAPELRVKIKTELEETGKLRRETSDELRKVLTGIGAGGDIDADMAAAFTEIGRYLGPSLANGLKNGAGDAVTAAASLGNAIIKAIRDTTGVHSLSPEGISIGKFLGDSTAVGLRNSIPGVEAAGRAVGEAALRGINTGMAGRGPLFRGGGSAGAVAAAAGVAKPGGRATGAAKPADPLKESARRLDQAADELAEGTKNLRQQVAATTGAAATSASPAPGAGKKAKKQSAKEIAIELANLRSDDPQEWARRTMAMYGNDQRAAMEQMRQFLGAEHGQVFEHRSYLGRAAQTRQLDMLLQAAGISGFVPGLERGSTKMRKARRSDTGEIVSSVERRGSGATAGGLPVMYRDFRGAAYQEAMKDFKGLGDLGQIERGSAQWDAVMENFSLLTKRFPWQGKPVVVDKKFKGQEEEFLEGVDAAIQKILVEKLKYYEDDLPAMARRLAGKKGQAGFKELFDADPDLAQYQKFGPEAIAAHIRKMGFSQAEEENFAKTHGDPKLEAETSGFYAAARKAVARVDSIAELIGTLRELDEKVRAEFRAKFEAGEGEIFGALADRPDPVIAQRIKEIEAWAARLASDGSGMTLGEQFDAGRAARRLLEESVGNNWRAAEKLFADFVDAQNILAMPRETLGQRQVMRSAQAMAAARRQYGTQADAIEAFPGEFKELERGRQMAGRRLAFIPRPSAANRIQYAGARGDVFEDATGETGTDFFSRQRRSEAERLAQWRRLNSVRARDVDQGSNRLWTEAEKAAMAAQIPVPPSADPVALDGLVSEYNRISGLMKETEEAANAAAAKLAARTGKTIEEVAAGIDKLAAGSDKQRARASGERQALLKMTQAHDNFERRRDEIMAEIAALGAVLKRAGDVRRGREMDATSITTDAAGNLIRIPSAVSYQQKNVQDEMLPATSAVRGASTAFPIHARDGRGRGVYFPGGSAVERLRHRQVMAKREAAAARERLVGADPVFSGDAAKERHEFLKNSTLRADDLSGQLKQLTADYGTIIEDASRHFNMSWNEAWESIEGPSRAFFARATANVRALVNKGSLTDEARREFEAELENAEAIVSEAAKGTYGPKPRRAQLVGHFQGLAKRAKELANFAVFTEESAATQAAAQAAQAAQATTQTMGAQAQAPASQAAQAAGKAAAQAATQAATQAAAQPAFAFPDDWVIRIINAIHAGADKVVAALSKVQAIAAPGAAQAAKAPSGGSQQQSRTEAERAADTAYVQADLMRTAEVDAYRAAHTAMRQVRMANDLDPDEVARLQAAIDAWRTAAIRDAVESIKAQTNRGDAVDAFRASRSQADLDLQRIVGPEIRKTIENQEKAVGERAMRTLTTAFSDISRAERSATTGLQKSGAPAAQVEQGLREVAQQAEAARHEVIRLSQEAESFQILDAQVDQVVGSFRELGEQAKFAARQADQRPAERQAAKQKREADRTARAQARAQSQAADELLRKRSMLLNVNRNIDNMLSGARTKVAGSSIGLPDKQAVIGALDNTAKLAGDDIKKMLADLDNGGDAAAMSMTELKARIETVAFSAKDAASAARDMAAAAKSAARPPSVSAAAAQAARDSAQKAADRRTLRGATARRLTPLGRRMAWVNQAAADSTPGSADTGTKENWDTLRAKGGLRREFLSALARARKAADIGADDKAVAEISKQLQAARVRADMEIQEAIRATAGFSGGRQAEAVRDVVEEYKVEIGQANEKLKEMIRISASLAKNFQQVEHAVIDVEHRIGQVIAGASGRISNNQAKMSEFGVARDSSGDALEAIERQAIARVTSLKEMALKAATAGNKDMVRDLVYQIRTASRQVEEAAGELVVRSANAVGIDKATGEIFDVISRRRAAAEDAITKAYASYLPIDLSRTRGGKLDKIGDLSDDYLLDLRELSEMGLEAAARGDAAVVKEMVVKMRQLGDNALAEMDRALAKLTARAGEVERQVGLIDTMQKYAKDPQSYLQERTIGRAKMGGITGWINRGKLGLQEAAAQAEMNAAVMKAREQFTGFNYIVSILRGNIGALVSGFMMVAKVVASPVLVPLKALQITLSAINATIAGLGAAARGVAAGFKNIGFALTLKGKRRDIASGYNKDDRGQRYVDTWTQYTTLYEKMYGRRYGRDAVGKKEKFFAAPNFGDASIKRQAQDFGALQSAYEKLQKAAAKQGIIDAPISAIGRAARAAMQPINVMINVMTLGMAHAGEETRKTAQAMDHLGNEIGQASRQRGMKKIFADMGTGVGLGFGMSFSMGIINAIQSIGWRIQSTITGIISRGFAAVVETEMRKMSMRSLAALQMTESADAGAADFGAIWEDAGAKAEDYYQTIVDIAKFSSFSRTPLLDAFQKFQVAGLTGENARMAVTAATMFGDAFQPGNKQMLDTFGTQASQMLQYGVAQTQDIKLMGEQGIPVFKFLAQNIERYAAMGLEEAKKAVAEDITKGEIGGVEAFEAIIQGMMEAAGQFKGKAATTFSGLMSTFQDLMLEKSEAVMSPVAENLFKPLVEFANVFLQSNPVSAAITEFGESVAATAAIVTEGLGAALGTIYGLWQSLPAPIQETIKALALAATIMGALTVAIATTAAIGALLAPVFSIVSGGMLAAAGALGAAIALYTTNFMGLRDLINNFVAGVGAALTTLGQTAAWALLELVGTVSQIIADLINGFTSNFMANAEALYAAVYTWWQSVTAAFAAGVGVMSGWIGQAITWLWTLPANMSSILGAVGQWFNDLFANFGAALQWLGEWVSGAIEAMWAIPENMAGIVDQMFTFGGQIVEVFAQGMQGAINVVFEALSAIGDMFTQWLEPHSPPKLLPDLDKWGTAAADIYLQGWTKADFGILNELSGKLEEAFAIDEGALEEGQFTAIRNAIAEMVGKAVDLGQADISSIMAAMPGWGGRAEQVARLSQAYANLAVSQHKLTVEQEMLDKITAQYDARLTPLQNKLKSITNKQEDLDLGKQIKEWQRVLDNVYASDEQKKAARLKMDELNLTKQINDIEMERDRLTDPINDRIAALTVENQENQKALDLANERWAVEMGIAKTGQGGAEGGAEDAADKAKEEKAGAEKNRQFSQPKLEVPGFSGAKSLGEIGDKMQKVSERIKGYFQDMADKAKPLTDAISGIGGGIDTMRQAIETGMTSGAFAETGGLAGFLNNVGVFAGTAIGVIDTLKLRIDGLVQAWTNPLGTEPGFGEAGGQIGPKTAAEAGWMDYGGFEPIVTTTEMRLSAVVEDLQFNLNDAKTKVKEFADGVKLAFDGVDWELVKTDVSTGLTNVTSAIRDWVAGIPGEIAAALGVAPEGDPVGNTVAVVGAADTAVSGATSSAGDIATKFVEWLADQIAKVDIVTVAAGAVGSATIFAGKLIDWILETIAALPLKEMGLEGGKVAGKAVAGTVLGAIFGGVVLSLSDDGEGGAQAAFNEVIDGIVMTVIGFLTSIFTEIQIALVEPITAVVNSIIDMINALPEWMAPGEVAQVEPEDVERSRQTWRDVQTEAEQGATNILNRDENPILLAGPGTTDLDPAPRPSYTPVPRPAGSLDPQVFVSDPARAPKPAWGSGLGAEWAMQPRETGAQTGLVGPRSLDRSMVLPTQSYTAADMSAYMPDPAQQQAIGQGVATGISTSAIDQMVLEIPKVVDSMLNGFFTALGINSPSTVMQNQVGLPIGQGIIAGMQMALTGGGGPAGAAGAAGAAGVAGIVAAAYQSILTATTVFGIALNVAFFNLKSRVTSTLGLLKTEWLGIFEETFAGAQEQFDAFSTSWVEEKAPALKDAIIELATQAKDGILQVMQDAVDGLQQKLDDMLAAIQSDDLKKNFYDAGYELGGSLVDGIVEAMTDTNADNEFSDMAEAVIAEIMRRLKEESGTASPSKVARDQIGVPLTQGIAVGMTLPRATRLLESSAGNVIEQIVQSFGGETPALRVSNNYLAQPERNMQSHGTGNRTYILNLAVTPQQAMQVEYNYRILEALA